MARPQTTTEPQTSSQQEESITTTTAQSSTRRGQQPAIADVPMATAPSTQRARAPLPRSTSSKRDVADDIAEGSASKQQRTSTEQTAPARPETTQEPPTTRTRIMAVTVTTKKGQEIKALSNEDEQKATAEKILLEPWVKNTEGLNREQTIERNETRDKVNESTTGVHRGFLQQPDKSTTKQGD